MVLGVSFLVDVAGTDIGLLITAWCRVKYDGWMENNEKWAPLSVREGRREPFKPAEGVPDFMQPSVQSWFSDMCQWLVNEEPRMLTIVDQAIQRTVRLPTFSLSNVAAGVGFDDEIVLDAIDFLLWRVDCDMVEGPWPLFGGMSAAENMEVILHQCGHVYRLNVDRRRLVRRVDETVWASYKHAMSVEDEASELIASAWAKQYSRRPDFSGAWEEANKAVLVLLRPIVSPNNEKATLSKLALEIRDGEDKFKSDLPGSRRESPVLQFARALETIGYPPNHHDSSVVDSRRSATAVLQAVTVVGWLRDGAFRRV